MAAFELLLSQARRHCLSTDPARFYRVLSHSSSHYSFLRFPKSFTTSSSSPSESSSEPNPGTRTNAPTRNPIPVETIAYPVKSAVPSEINEDPPQSESPPIGRQQVSDGVPRQPENVQGRSWSREDIRYVKDAPSIDTVSYAVRVAPLPEDRVAGEERQASEESGKGLGLGKEGHEQLEGERRRIEANSRMMRRAFKVEEERLPFPTLIPVVQKKKEKVIYDLKEAIRLVKANAKGKFDETVEVHVKMAVDLRRTDLKLSGTARLPHGLGKGVKVAVFAEGPAADEAKAAGADIVGGQELIERIKNGTVKVNFDRCISTPQLMPRVGKEISKILKRLTPNPRSGTVTNDVTRVVREAKENIDIKKDKSAIVHVGLGKVSFPEEDLRENVGAFVNALLLAKPAGLKKSSKYAGYVSTFHICSTLGPSFPVSIQSLSIAADQYNRQQIR